LRDNQAEVKKLSSFPGVQHAHLAFEAEVFNPLGRDLHLSTRVAFIAWFGWRVFVVIDTAGERKTLASELG